MTRGFARMNPDKVKAIASMGGKAAHRAGTAHKFTVEEAQEAGRKGGTALVDQHGVEHMSEIGKRGGLTTSTDREHMSDIGKIGASVTNRK